MDIDQYILEADSSYSELGRELGYTYGYVSQVAKKKMVPGLKFVKAIEKYTDKKVMAKDVLPPEHIYFQ
jgi:hypothetical protein